MSLSEWTMSHAAWVLDSAIKVEGTSSLRDNGWGYPTPTPHYIQRDSVSQYQAIFWLRTTNKSRVFGTAHPSYGVVNINTYLSAINTFEKFRITEWYDSANNTRWSRIEKMVDEEWVKQTDDINQGSGAPDSNPFRIYSVIRNDERNYVDELYLYDVS